MKYIVAVLLAFSALAAERMVEPSQAIGATRIDDAQKSGEKFFDLDGDETNSRYANYLDNVKRREIEYYRKVRAARAAFYKRMQER
ncbi:MAG: hypothetical protein LBO72_08995 [Helicobacteraceae bacterium]|jgi:hypothetical protein|nr:hypothetical protein [Helicobacteraceae bacterium]